MKTNQKPISNYPSSYNRRGILSISQVTMGVSTNCLLMSVFRNGFSEISNLITVGTHIKISDGMYSYQSLIKYWDYNESSS